MSIIPSIALGGVWKIATIGAGVITLLLGSLLTASYFENRDLMKQRGELIAQITDPKTGYVAQLSQARTNVATLTQNLDDQRHSFELKAEERERVLATTQAELEAAQKKTADMDKRLSGFLATKPKGATLEDRIRDIDSRGMSEMVK